MFLGIFKILRRGISLTSQLTSAKLFLFWTPPAVAGADALGRSTLVITKLMNQRRDDPITWVGGDHRSGR